MIDLSNPVILTIVAIVGLLVILAVILALNPPKRSIEYSNDDDYDNQPYTWKHGQIPPSPKPTPRKE